MAEQPMPLHDFETFPRQPLFGISRREFFKMMGIELKLYTHMEEGVSAIKIPELGSMADAELYEFIPKILPDCEINIIGGQVWGQPRGKTEAVVLFNNEDISAYAFNLINGQNTLKTIAETLASHAGLPLERAFAFTRGLFLTLVKAGVCLPCNNPFLG
jgi:hypothetical protein